MEVTSSKPKLHIENAEFIKFGAWTLCLKEQTLRDANNSKELEPLIFELLILFLKNADKIVTRQELVDQVWQQNFVDDNSINRAMSELRKVLKSPDYDGQYIKTHYKKGYRFLPNVEIIGTSSKAIEEAETVTEIPEGTNSTTFSYNPKPKPQKPFYVYVMIAILIPLVIFIRNEIDNPNAVKSSTPSESEINKNIEQKITSMTDLFRRRGMSFVPKMSNGQSKLAYSFREKVEDVMQIYVRDMGSQAEVKIDTGIKEAYPLAWAGESTLFYQTLTTTPEWLCEIWRIDFAETITQFSINKVKQCDSHYILSATVDTDATQMVYTKRNYRGKKGLAALVHRDLITGEEYQLTSPDISAQGDYIVKASNDFAKVIYARAKSLVSGIYVKELDGGEPLLISEIDYQIGAFDWHDDNTKVSWVNPKNWQVNTYDLKTKKITYGALSLDFNFNDLYGIELKNDSRVILTTDYVSLDAYAFDTRSKSFIDIAYSDKKESLIEPFNTKQGGVYLKQGQYQAQSLWMFNTLQKSHVLDLDIKEINSVAVSPNDEKVLISNSHAINIYALSEKSLINTIEMEYKIKHVSWHDNDTLLLLFENGSKMTAGLFSVTNKILEQLSSLHAVAAKSVNNNEVAILDTKKVLHFISTDNKKQKRQIDLHGVTPWEWAISDGKVFFMDGNYHLMSRSIEGVNNEAVLVHEFKNKQSPLQLETSINFNTHIIYMSGTTFKENSLLDIKIADQSP